MKVQSELNDKITYQEFLETKKKKAKEVGFEVEDSKLNSKLF